MARRVAEAALALSGFTALALALFQPTPSELAHTAPAFRGQSGDALLLAWATSHVSRALLQDPRHLFDAPMLHPLPATLAYSDHMIGQALVGLPIWLATGNPLLEYNLLVLASYAFGAVAMLAYARAIGLGVLGAAAAGLVFAFSPFRFHSPLWLQVLFTPFMPLALLAWTRFVAHLRWRDLALFVACWTLHGLMGMYLALYFSVVMGALLLHAVVAAPTRHAARLRVGALTAPVATAVLLAPTLLPYVLLRGHQGHVRSGGLDTHLSFFLPGPGTLTGVLTGLEGPGQFGPGLTAWVLVLLGLVAGRRRTSAGALPARFVWQATMIGLGLTVLFVLVPLRFQQLLPGFDMIRGTNRAFFVTLLFLGVCVGWAVDWIAARPRAGRAMALALLVLLVVDVGTPPRERKRFPVADDVPPAQRWLRDLPADTIVYERALGPDPIALAMYLQVFHGKRLPIGYTGFVSPATTYLNFRLFRFPAPESLRLLRTLGVGYVLQHFPTAPLADAAAATLPPGVSVAARFGTDVVFHLGPDPHPPVPTAPAMPIPRAAWTATATLRPETLGALVDGDPTTAWGGNVAFGTRPALTIDLGTPHEVAGVRCVPAPLSDPSEIGGFTARVELSDDGLAWDAVPGGFEPDSLTALFEEPGAPRFWELRFAARRARVVRLTNPDASFWGGPWRIAEVEVLGVRAP